MMFGGLIMNNLRKEKITLLKISIIKHTNPIQTLTTDWNWQLNIEKLPPTSSSIQLHVKRAYLQTYTWLHALFAADLDINPLRYGYEVEDEDDDCEDTISKVVADVMPEDFLMPCKCVKCARENVCSCRKHGLHCCKYCNCKADACKNLHGFL